MRAEVRGRGYRWRVYYPDESGLASPVKVYDRDGNLKEVIEVGAPTGNLSEAYGGPFQSPRLAKEYAESLGATEVVIKKLATRRESLAKARTARKQRQS